MRGEFLIVFVFLMSSTATAWYDPFFNYRIPLTLEIDQNRIDTQVLFNITHDSRMEDDFSDIRITDENDTLMPAFDRYIVQGSYAELYVRGNFINGSTYYVYFNITNGSDNYLSGWEVGNQFDDFEDGSIDIIWSGSESHYTEENGYIRGGDQDSTSYSLYTHNSFQQPLSIETYMLEQNWWADGDDTPCGIVFGFNGTLSGSLQGYSTDSANLMRNFDNTHFDGSGERTGGAWFHTCNVLNTSYSECYRNETLKFSNNSMSINDNRGVGLYYWEGADHNFDAKWEWIMVKDYISTQPSVTESSVESKSSSYTYALRRPINCTNMTGQFGIVNGRTGFTLNNYTQQVWINCTEDEQFLYYNSFDEYTITNSSGGLLPFDVSYGNEDSVNPHDVYNADIIYHLSNLQDSTQRFNLTSENSANLTVDNSAFDGRFDANGDSTDHFSADWFDTEDQISIISWSNITDNDQSRSVIYEQSETGDGYYQLYMDTDGGPTMKFDIYSAGVATALATFGTVNPFDGEYHMLSGTYDGISGRVTIEDGVCGEQASIDDCLSGGGSCSCGVGLKVTSSPPSGGSFTQANNLGIDRDAQSNQQYSGSISEVFVFNRNFTYPEIWNLFYNGNTTEGYASLGDFERLAPPFISSIEDDSNLVAVNDTINWTATVKGIESDLTYRILVSAGGNFTDCNFSVQTGNACFAWSEITNNTTTVFSRIIDISEEGTTTVWLSQICLNNSTCIEEGIGFYDVVDIQENTSLTATVPFPSPVLILSNFEARFEYICELSYLSLCTNGEPITGASCQITIDSETYNMSFDPSEELYISEFFSGETESTVNWNGTCSKANHQTQTASGSFIINEPCAYEGEAIEYLECGLSGMKGFLENSAVGLVSLISAIGTAGLIVAMFSYFGGR